MSTALACCPRAICSHMESCDGSQIATTKNLERAVRCNLVAMRSSVLNLKSAIVWTQLAGKICRLREADDGATSSGFGVDGFGA